MNQRQATNRYLLITYKPLFLLFGVCLALAACEKTPQLTPLANNAVILAFGDSLTSGVGAKPDESYPKQLEQLLSKTVINAGVSGEISATGLQRLPALLTKYKPDLVILCHGGNDILRRLSLDKTRQNLQSMLQLIKNQGAEVIIIGVPEFGLFLEPAPLYIELAEENNIPIENNVLSDILGKVSLRSDHIHPNKNGYKKISKSIYKLLVKTGAIEA